MQASFREAAEAEQTCWVHSNADRLGEYLPSAGEPCNSVPVDLDLPVESHAPFPVRKCHGFIWFLNASWSTLLVKELFKQYKLECYRKQKSMLAGWVIVLPWFLYQPFCLWCGRRMPEALNFLPRRWLVGALGTALCCGQARTNPFHLSVGRLLRQWTGTCIWRRNTRAEVSLPYPTAACRGLIRPWLVCATSLVLQPVLAPVPSSLTELRYKIKKEKNCISLVRDPDWLKNPSQIDRADIQLFIPHDGKPKKKKCTKTDHPRGSHVPTI